MLFTINTKQGALVIDFDVRWSNMEERYMPVNITEYSPQGKYSPIELTDKQYNKVLDYLSDYESEGDSDHLVKWLCAR